MTVFAPSILTAAPGPDLADIARGLVPGKEQFGGYGEIITAGAVTNQVIWPDGTYRYPPAGGLPMQWQSTDAQDGVGGTGARTLEIHYLDANGDPKTEQITMNGLTPVLMVATDVLFIQCAHLTTVGSTKAAVGTITATNGGLIYAQIAPLDVRCASSARRVPRGKRCMVKALYAGASSGTAAASARVRIVATELDAHQYTTEGIFIPHGASVMQDSGSSLILDPPLPFSAGTIVAMTTTVDKAALVTGSWFGWIEDAI